ncbi:DUF4421 domain-containing protein [Flavihumibacter sp. RY-1]|uniref:DUF4421 domain-containing protein n=1 Tax=Flavihumibacter fluminis TaxID=2909236 RepID=A0ABS9BKA6_9BACT|nr:DUF4421 domain-containing protein [Flavihumibacter fluminis]MCF1716030.1 DUF4421 domain-containing protein [Flavihumibacter fluminis]
MNEYITFKLAQTTDQENFSVFTNGTKSRIDPNASSVSTLSVNYSFISLSVRFVPHFLPGNRDTKEKGKTRSGGLALNFYLDHWLQELSYQRTRGYYLENTADFRPGWQDGDPYIQFPDLQYRSFQGMTGYKFNRNFSLNALATQSERQLKSAGSFIPQLLYRYYTIDDKTKLVNPGQTSQRSNNLELVLGAGYYHNFVLKGNFYFALGVTPGAGILFMNLTTRSGNGERIKTRQQDFIFRLDSRAGIGYNGERFFGGLYATAFTSSYRQENTQVVNGNARIVFKLFAGYRIPAPRVIKERVSTIKTKLTNKLKK